MIFGGVSANENKFSLHSTCTKIQDSGIHQHPSPNTQHPILFRKNTKKIWYLQIIVVNLQKSSIKQTKVDEQTRIETRQRLENGKSYKWLQKIADIMDRYYLDAALGFAIPGGIGDAIAAVFSTGYILFSAFGVRSFPLTLAIMNNTLRNVVLGMIPFYVGDIFDIFHRSNRQNMSLIRGFVEGDEQVIHDVNRKAGYSVVIWAAQYMFSLF